MTNKTKTEDHLDFDGQRPNEKLLFVFRRHLIAMRKGFYLLLIPMVVTSIPILIWQQEVWLYFVFLGGFGLGLILFLYRFVLWYFTIYIVSDQRIRQITQKGFFGKDVIEVRLSKIQNISYNIPGFSGEVFKFGTIVIQTIVGDLVIEHVEHPDKIYNKLQDAVNNASEDKESIE